MPHFIIVLIKYINLLNLSWIMKCLFLRNMEPVRKSTNDVQRTKRALMQFADNTGPDQLAHSHRLMGPSLLADRINVYCSIC